MRQEKFLSDINIVRDMLNQVDKRLVEESQNRTQSQDEVKVYFEQKFSVLNERITYNEASAIEREKRLM